MLLSFTIRAHGLFYCYHLLSYSDFQIVHLDNVIHLEIWKKHNHSYGFAGFLYKAQCLVYPREFRTKKELHGAIQKLLQEKLYVDVQ